MKLDKTTETFLIHVVESVREEDLTGSIINLKSLLAGWPDAEIARALCYLNLEVEKLTKERNILQLREDLRKTRTKTEHTIPV